MRVTKKTRWGIPALLFMLALTFGLVLAGCNPDPGDGGNPFVGTWTGYDPTLNVISRVIVDNSTWTLSWPGNPQYGVQTGTYTYSGNTITLFQSGVAMGTGTVSGNTVTMIVTGWGTMILTKQT